MRKTFSKKKLKQKDSVYSITPSKEDYLEMVYKLEEEDKLPAIFFIFSRKEGKEVLQFLSGSLGELTTEEEQKQIKEIINDYEKNGKYLGESLDINAIVKGLAIHNAGMLPNQKELVEELFQKKLLKVVISTETLSAGINMPARTTIITSLRKPTENPDGADNKRYINPNEFHQMAGRAGRRGIDTKGYCYVMALNDSQIEKYQELIETPFNDIESHLDLEYSFVIAARSVYNDKDRLKSLFQHSLYAYDKNPEINSQKTDNIISEFCRKENILKKYGYIRKDDNSVTEKGFLLTKLNGYEQIPIINVFASGELFDLNPVQLAGFVAGLANMEVSQINDECYEEDEILDVDDGTLMSLMDHMNFYTEIYNKGIYLQENRKLRQNMKAINHVYRWAKLNNNNDDAIYNWRKLYSSEHRKALQDEGTLFREIKLTSDLLKQMGEIALLAQKVFKNPEEQKQYEKLYQTIQKSIKLINRGPAEEDDFV